jgi:hypothetical protein
MRSLDNNQIRDEFNAKKQNFAKWLDETGLSNAIKDLSRAVSDLKSAGLDIDLQLFGDASEQAFGMFPRGNGLTVPVSGDLRIGRHHHLVAFAVKVDGKPALQLGLSQFDIRFTGPYGSLAFPKIGQNGASAQAAAITSVVRANVYDLANDAEALVKFQKEIIRDAARDAFIDELDESRAFDNGNSLGKPIRLIPKT